MDEEEEEEEETSLQEVQAVAKMMRRDLDQVLSSISSPQAALLSQPHLASLASLLLLTHGRH